MDSLINFKTVQRIQNNSCYENRHSMVRLIDFENEKSPVSIKVQMGWYVVLLTPSDHHRGCLSFSIPGKADDRTYSLLPDHPVGQALIFHPELVRMNLGTDCNFFIHRTGQPVLLSPGEYLQALDSFFNIRRELIHAPDKYSRRLIASNIDLFLSYCERFFSTDVTEKTNHDVVLQRFDQLLSRYFLTEGPFNAGIPSVAYFAEGLNLSANYFGSLVKKKTGKTAQEYIRDKILDEAKYKISTTHKTINEIATDLGFRYPQHFSRLFKNVLGKTPNEYRNVVTMLSH